jgi:copper homeostasis protein
MTVEIACNNFQSCLNAMNAGADRIELFENLGEGGCTPSFGMIKKVLTEVSIPVYVMIRPRGGDFVYSLDEIDIMKNDILMCKELKADGIVFGMLNKDGSVDVETCADLLQAWDSKTVSFHRAIDRCIDIEKSMEDIINLGFERVLTSGGYKTVSEGKGVIKSLQEKFGEQIIIMPGSGVTPFNAAKISEFCGTSEIHATCKGILKQDIKSNSNFSDPFSISQKNTIEELVRAVKN